MADRPRPADDPGLADVPRLADDPGLERLAGLLALARAAGADAADALLVARDGLCVRRRLGRTEHVGHTGSRDLGVRVFLGRRSAIVAADELGADAPSLAAMVERAMAMARSAPEDKHDGPCGQAAPFAGTPGPEDDARPDVASLTDRAALAEEAALTVTGVTGSGGAAAGFRRTRVALATSAGFAGAYARTIHTVAATALAGDGAGQGARESHAAVRLAGLEDAGGIGRRAGERAVRERDPVSPRAGTMPVLYDPAVSGTLLRHLAEALDGDAVARGASFLAATLGRRLLAPGLQVIDDPARRLGLRSRPFDAEGVPAVARALVDDGVLLGWLLDGRSARRLGLASTGHAARTPGTASRPAPTNLYLAPGLDPSSALLAGIAEGVYVTALRDTTFDAASGDYHSHATGLLIRDGVLAEAAAFTLAGSLGAMLATLVPADDLRFRRGMDAPTCRVEGMAVGASGAG